MLLHFNSNESVRIKNSNPCKIAGIRISNYAEIKNKTGSNSYYISISQWIKETNAVGLRTSVGRYGGTFAHKDITI